ncbi:retrovirus-related Pol polyprotein from transposon TNT 1-94, partial [Trifolium pratense]
MRSLFGFQDTLEVVTNGVQELQANATPEQRNSYRDLKKKDSKAMYATQAACYEGEEKVKNMKLQALRSQYEVLEMDKNESIAEYVSKVQGLVHTMKNCGEIITDRMIIEKVMRTLIPNYDHIIAAIQESGSFPTMQLEDLVGSLEAHELVINKRKNAQEIVQAMQVETFKKNGGNKGKNHDKSKNFSQKHNKFDGKSESFKKGGGTSNSKKK